MAQAAVADYYSTLNLPHTADLLGIENAYARLSDELAPLAELDPGCRESLQRINEAYSILSRPELRRQYDAVFLAKERDADDRRFMAYVRKRIWAQRLILFSLSLIVIAQAGALLYMGRDDVGNLLDALPF